MAAAGRSRRGATGGRGPRGSGLGSTTHITVVDGEGSCASVTCSNGTGSGLVVPGTGIHVNNMLGEEDLNPLGFHRCSPGRRMPSMMSPTIVLRDGELEAGLGSGGSNRIRSAVLQAILRMVVDGADVAEAVTAPRLHFEGGIVQAEPGVDEGGAPGAGAARHRRCAMARAEPVLRRRPRGDARRRDGRAPRRRRPPPRRRRGLRVDASRPSGPPGVRSTRYR